MDAVEEAIKVMELDENFNAGYGSVLTCAGTVEMEASFMVGRTGKVGCTTLLKNIMHPISVARKVMELTPHNFIGGDAAIDFAKSQGFEILPEGALVTEYSQKALEEWKESHDKGEKIKFARTEVGTVGAVAMDAHGNLAVGTSTGGITGKFVGRIGDTPIIGAGTYCNQQIGVSTTGHGETIMKSSLAHDIVKRYEYLKANVQKATKDACEEMTRRFEGTGGAITLDALGDVGVYFTSTRMAWAYQKQNQVVFGIEKGEILTEVVA